MNNLILEDGYNTDYIYSMIIALFYIPSSGMSKIINTDTNNSNTYYVQEYIKLKFMYPIHRNMSIESSTINKFRNFLYNCGWLKSDDMNDKNILDKSDLDKFYSFLIADMMGYKLRFIRIDPTNNISRELKFDMIKITDELLFSHDNENKIINLNSSINQWARDMIGENVYSYKFESVPFVIPVFLDIRDPETGLNKKYINIMEGLNFDSNGDKLQRMFIWEIHSVICQTSSGDYYAVTIDHNDAMMMFSDKMIPSNWKIDSTDILSVKKLMREVRFVFYKLQ
jgi:hypothetical protein